jgi:hypothetical protein
MVGAPVHFGNTISLAMGGVVQLILFWHLHDFWEEFFLFVFFFRMTSIREREIKWGDIYEG